MKGLGCTLGLETGAPSRLTPLQATQARTPEGGVDTTFVAAEGWGVTRRTSMSDISEQLAGRSGVRSGPMLAVTPEPDSFNQQITDKEPSKAAKSSHFHEFTSLFCTQIRFCVSLDLSHVFNLTGLLSNSLL